MRVKLREFSMEYDDAGSGPPVLFVHGFPLNRSLWDSQVRELSKVARVIAPDLRGHGDSGATPAPYSMDMLADDCHDLLAALRITQPVVLCGLSMGGYVAFAYYRKYADQVAGLILASTRADADSIEGKANRDKAAATAREKGVGPIVEAMLPKMLSPKSYETQLDRVADIRRMMARTSLDGVIGDLMGMKGRPDSIPLLAKIAARTLVIHGKDDQIIPPKEAEAMQAAIKNSRLCVLPEAGHLLNMEQAGLFNNAVKEFVGSL